LNLDSHVTKTGDIKSFVITEESGIAKGIRRITAVTGHEAHEVTRIAKNLEAKLDQLELKSGKEKDNGLKAFSVVRKFVFFSC
jgi:alanyl-tRNA synthetase